MTINKSEDAMLNLSSGWKVCVTSRTKMQRDNYCTRSFNNNNSIGQCKVNYFYYIFNNYKFLKLKNIFFIFFR